MSSRKKITFFYGPAALHLSEGRPTQPDFAASNGALDSEGGAQSEIGPVAAVNCWLSRYARMLALEMPIMPEVCWTALLDAHNARSQLHLDQDLGHLASDVADHYGLDEVRKDWPDWMERLIRLSGSERIVAAEVIERFWGVPNEQAVSAREIIAHLTGLPADAVFADDEYALYPEIAEGFRAGEPVETRTASGAAVALPLERDWNDRTFRMLVKQARDGGVLVENAGGIGPVCPRLDEGRLVSAVVARFEDVIARTVNATP